MLYILVCEYLCCALVVFTSLYKSIYGNPGSMYLFSLLNENDDKELDKLTEKESTILINIGLVVVSLLWIVYLPVSIYEEYVKVK